MRRSIVVLCAIWLASAMLCGTSAATAQALPEVEIETSVGLIVVELNSEKAPKTVANFLEYTKSGFFEGTIFHRVIPGFMIQAGGRTADLTKKKTGDPVENEAGNGLANKKYTIAMARLGDPDSATSQFFINTNDNASLNRAGRQAGYTVFGRVVKGLDVVDKIEAVKTGSRKSPDPPRIPGFRVPPLDDVPLEPIVIKSVKLRQ